MDPAPRGSRPGQRAEARSGCGCPCREPYRGYAHRVLRRTPVPPGPAGVDALIEPVRAALDGRGPAIAPVPVTSVTVSADYVGRLMRALRPDDPDAPLESDDIAVVLATSGSTGDPRGVLHTAASLTAMTDAVQGGADPQWIIALPVTSMGGFNVLVRSLATTHSPMALASIGGAQPFTPADFASAVDRAQAADIRVSLVAAQVRRLLGDDAGIDALRACRQVLVGGGPAPDSLVESARALGIGLTRTYGATETAGGCVFEGRALPGVTVRIAKAGRPRPPWPSCINRAWPWVSWMASGLASTRVATAAFMFSIPLRKLPSPKNP